MLIVTWFSHLAAAPIASWYEFERLEFSSKSLSISVDCESICQQDDKPITPSDGIYTEKVLFFFVNKRIYTAKFRVYLHQKFLPTAFQPLNGYSHIIQLPIKFLLVFLRFRKFKTTFNQSKLTISKMVGWPLSNKYISLQMGLELIIQVIHHQLPKHPCHIITRELEITNEN